jgi:hypothetical protein
MITSLMATGLGLLAGAQHAATGPDHSAASLLVGLAWIGVSP